MHDQASTAKQLDAAEFLNEIDQIAKETSATLEELESRIPAVGYAIPMIIDCAEVQANAIVDQTYPWGTADFSALFRDMLTLLHKTATKTPNQTQKFQPYFNTAQQLDPNIETCLALEHFDTILLNKKVTVNSNLKQVVKEGARYKLSLADSRRRSAITLLRHKALFLRSSKAEQELLALLPKSIMELDQNEHQKRVIELMFKLDLREINILRKGLPKTWCKLIEAVGFDDTDAVTFLAFTTALTDMMSKWHQADALFDLLTEFTTYYNRKPIERDQFDTLLNLFSSDLALARRVGTAVPFLKLGSWYRYWPFAYHIMLPELVLITLLQQKHEKAWSQTFGTDMAKIADVIASQLPHFPNISMETCKIKKGVGDIDLAIYDKERKHLLICEIKTVFDKFRTDFQSRNFLEQKVNFNKAFKQLKAAHDALESKTWSLNELFMDIKDSPAHISRLVLVWRDHANPSLDTANYTPVSDFTSFTYLYERCAGNLQTLLGSIEQLEKIFMVSTHVDDCFPHDEEQLLFSYEMEIGCLPPLKFLEKMSLNNVVREEIESLGHLPADWEQQQAANNDDQVYLFKSSLV